MTDPRDARPQFECSWCGKTTPLGVNYPSQAQADLAAARAEIARLQQRLGECEGALDTGQRAIADNAVLRAEIEHLGLSLRDEVTTRLDAEHESATLRAQVEAARAALEQAAKYCDEPMGVQHPLKPAGVSMVTEPAAPVHAQAIRHLLASLPAQPASERAPSINSSQSSSGQSPAVGMMPGGSGYGEGAHPEPTIDRLPPTTEKGGEDHRPAQSQTDHSGPDIAQPPSSQAGEALPECTCGGRMVPWHKRGCPMGIELERRASAQPKPASEEMERAICALKETHDLLIGDGLDGLADDVQTTIALLRRFSAESVAGQWRTIETAPKDGTQILAFAAGSPPRRVDFYSVAQWAEANGMGSVEGWFWSFAIRPTHWQPLPLPPEGDAS